MKNAQGPSNESKCPVLGPMNLKDYEPRALKEATSAPIFPAHEQEPKNKEQN